MPMDREEAIKIMKKAGKKVCEAAAHIAVTTQVVGDWHNNGSGDSWWEEEAEATLSSLAVFFRSLGEN